MIKNTSILVAILIVIAFLFSKKIRTSRKWQATVTPLASIIGSGFLIIAPLLALTVGGYALIAITVLVILGYACGEVMRFNIHHIEPLLEKREDKILMGLEDISKFSLGLAYIVSITFYLQLLAAFVLKGFNSKSEFLANILTTIILVIIAIVGKIYGLNMLEKLEEYSVSIKLAIIAGLLVGLGYFNLELFFAGDWKLKIPEVSLSVSSLRVLFGSLIVVQGFETSRFLGSKYKPKERVETMRNAQILSGIIYFIFIGLILAVFDRKPHISDTEIIDLSSKVASILPIALIIAAGVSQFSAAVADTAGAGGLIVESFRKKISLRNSYILICGFAIILTWATNVFEVVSVASRIFAFYYGMQAGEATMVSYRKKFWGKGIFFGVLTLILTIITIFGNPANV